MSTTSTSGDDIFVSLEPPPLAEDPSQTIRSFRNLNQIIPQISLERGSFIDITEENLRKEIEQLQNRDGQPYPEQENRQDERSKVKPNATNIAQFEEDFNNARADLSRLIGAAQNEAAISLDFISLLISSVRPVAGTTSMSPHLKSHVPVGSLGTDRVKPQPYVEDMSVCLGWKTQSISAATERFARAAGRLAEEAEREKKYWEQVEEIAVCGEVLSKMRMPDYKGMGVRYGFADAGSTYKEKGIATLRRNADGNLVLKTEGEKRTKVLSVAIWRRSDGEPVRTGQHSTKINYESTDVKAEIKQARDLLFEDELFFQIARETRTLASQGITLDFGNKVTMPLPGLQVVLETIDIEDQDNSMDVDGGPDSVIAEAINVVLHLLLSKLHRKNLEARRSIPLPLGTRRHTADTGKSEILEPLIRCLAVEPIKSSLMNLIADLMSALKEK
ncbi:mediator complex, subunit Med17 [Lipomyces orientalis]|uniref:Mediator complex, subunit Med17 n=1 Tax=Lipomyces orientalis TaxID=1233043 RepID=A0ACC3TQV6_9ASCO